MSSSGASEQAAYDVTMRDCRSADGSHIAPGHGGRPAAAHERSVMGILSWIVLGLIAGFLAGQFMKGGGYGLIGDIVLGIVGALVGGFLSSQLLGIDVNGFNIVSILIAFVGACIVIAIGRMLSGNRARA
jgi:uncharacterized membrane protein YeaQ/YmgE (transglycosylase-associated protein family)